MQSYPVAEALDTRFPERPDAAIRDIPTQYLLYGQNEEANADEKDLRV
jgi:hypothetical protein